MIERPNGMKLKIMGFFEWIIRSADPFFYRRLALVPVNLAIYFYALLSVVCVAIISFSIALHSYQLIGRFAETYGLYLPVMEVSDHVLQIPGDEIIRQGMDTFEIILDPTDDAELSPYFKSGVIIRKTHVQVQTPHMPPFEFKYKDIPLPDTSPQLIISPETIRSVQIPLFFAILVLGGGIRFFTWSIVKTFQILIGSFVVDIMGQIRRVNMLPSKRFVVSITAIVPVSILQTVMDSMHIASPHFQTIYLIIYGLFLIVGTFQFIQPFLDTIKKSQNQ